MGKSSLKMLKLEKGSKILFPQRKWELQKIDGIKHFGNLALKLGLITQGYGIEIAHSRNFSVTNSCNLENNIILKSSFGEEFNYDMMYGNSLYLSDNKEILGLMARYDYLISCGVYPKLIDFVMKCAEIKKPFIIGYSKEGNAETTGYQKEYYEVLKAMFDQRITDTELISVEDEKVKMLASI